MRKLQAVLIFLLIQTDPAFAQDMSDFVTSLTPRFDLQPLEISDLDLDPVKARSAVIFTALLHTNELHIHRMRGAINNVVYIGPEGHREAVYEFDLDENGAPIDGTGRVVTDCHNEASYNYFNPSKYPYAHFSADMLPWIMMGNCRNDITTVSERIDAYLLDLQDGLDRIINLRSGFYKPIFEDDENNGQLEALAFLLKALEKGGFEIDNLSPKNFIHDAMHQELIESLRIGLNNLLADA